VIATLAEVAWRRSVLGRSRTDSFRRICRLGGVFVAAPRDEPEDRPRRVPCVVLCQALGGCGDRGRSSVGREDWLAPAATHHRRHADSGSLRRGVPGLHRTDGDRTGWRVGEEGTPEVLAANEREKRESPQIALMKRRSNQEKKNSRGISVVDGRSCREPTNKPHQSLSALICGYKSLTRSPAYWPSHTGTCVRSPGIQRSAHRQEWECPSLN